MASAEKLRREKEIDHALGKLGAGDTPAERAHVRVVVRAAHLRAEAVGQQRAADAGDLVRRERHADARAADKDSLFVLPFRNAARGALGVFGIVAARFGIGADILKLDALFLQVRHQLLLEGVAAVVRCNNDHDVYLLCLFQR